MKSGFSKKIIIFSLSAVILLSGLLCFTEIARAVSVDQLGISYGAETGLATTDIRITVARIVRAALGLLGIVAVALLIYAGFVWMTAGGNDENINKAKKIMINAVIGLAIILSAYAIVSFVMSKLVEATAGLPAHCSNGVQDADETNIDCGGSCGSCGGENPYLPGAGGFFVANLPASGQLCLRNVHPVLIFSKDVDVDTLNNNNNVAIVRENGNVVVAGSWAYGARNSMVVFNPTGSCAPDDPNKNDCLEGNTPYILKFNNLSAVRSIGTPLTSPEALIGCRDSNTGRISQNSCSGVRFITGAKIDINPPLISFVAPRAGSRFQIGAAVPIRLYFEDDLGIQNVALYEGNWLIGAQSFTGCQATGTVDIIWPSTGLTQGNHTLTGLDMDWSSATGTARRGYVLDPPHCSNGIQDPSEEGVDCGGLDCGLCAGDSCTEDSQCAGGLCQNGVCVNRMVITGFTPNSGASSTYVSIAGRYFGNQEGAGGVYFARQANPQVNNPAHWIKANVVSCGGNNPSWYSSQIVAKLPAQAVSGPIKVITDGATFTDTTDDDWGSILPDFQVNNILRPGVCAILPNSGLSDSTVSILGEGFGVAQDNAEDKVMFGATKATVAVNNWTNGSITTKVPLLDGGKYGVSVFNNGVESNSVAFNILGGVQTTAPQILNITPSTGTEGEYVTIEGRNFGKTVGKVYFKLGAQTQMGDLSFPADCANAFWKDNKVIVKFPRGVGAVLGKYFVQVVNAEQGNTVSALDANINFTLVAGSPSPGVCAITPISAPVPYPALSQPMKITGEYFGNNVNGIDVLFWTQQASRVNTNNRAAVVKINNDFAISPAGDQITFRPPNTAKSGDVVVLRRADSKVSNPVSFDVLDCRVEAPNKPKDTCSDVTARCCPSNGTCIPAGDLCEGETRSTGYVWRFCTKDIPPVPRVVEQCDGNAVLPSPSPSALNSGNISGNTCLTALAIVEFSTNIDPLSISKASNNLVVNQCASIADNNCVNPQPVNLTNASYNLLPAAVGEAQNTQYIRIQPVQANGSNKWAARSFYQVVLKTGIRSAGVDSMPLAQDRPCGVGTAYCYTFGTGAEDCSLGAVLVTPYRFWTNVLEAPILYRVPGLLDTRLVYRGLGLSSQRCIAMDMQGFNWAWSVANRGGDYARIFGAVNSDSAMVSARANTVNEGALAAPPQYAVNISARASRPATADHGAESQTGNSPLTIDLTKPEVVSRWPDCLEACTNAVVGVKFNTTMSSQQRLPLTRVFSPVDTQSVRLLQCLNENCSATRLVANTNPSFSPDRMTLNVNHNGLLPNTIYKVVLSAPSTTPNIPQLGSGVDLNNPLVFGYPYDKEYSWRFRTKKNACIISSVEVTPPVFEAVLVAERTIYQSQPRSAPDTCDAKGQKLNPRSVGWSWLSSRPLVATTQSFATIGSNKNCTSYCIRKGSDILATAAVSVSICGNNRIEAGEDCDPPLANSCSLDCLRLPASSRRIGSQATTAASEVSASICGNGFLGITEDCDLGIAPNVNATTSAMNCSEKCLHLGSRISNQWCQTNLTNLNRYGGFTEEDYNNACNQSYSQCGNGVQEPDEDPGCDIAAGVSANCNEYCLLKTGDAAVDIPAGANNNSCAGADRSYSIGCDPNIQQHIGSYLLYSAPSVCGDGIIGLGEDAYCENRAFFTSTNTIFAGLYRNDPWVLATSVGTGVIDQSLVPPAQKSDITASTNQNTGGAVKSGKGEFRINCGFVRDSQCPAGQGVGSDSCCYDRPQISNQIPDPGRVNACPNTVIEATFSDVIDPASLTNNIVIAQGVDGNCPNGTADVSTLVASAQGAENLPWYKNIFVKVFQFFRGLFVDEVIAQGVIPLGQTWCAGNDLGSAEVIVLNETTSKVRVKLFKPLQFGTDYRIIFREDIRDAKGVGIGRMANDTSINWGFRTSNAICTVNSVSIDPSSKGFQRAYTSSTFMVYTAALDGQYIQPLQGFYDWRYEWGPPNDIVSFGETVTTSPINILSALNRDGELDVRAAVNVTTNQFGDRSLGIVGNGRTHILVTLCENNWPPLDLFVDTNNDGQMDAGPYLVSPYSDKVGNTDGFDLNKNIFNHTAISPAVGVGDYFNFSTYYCADNGSSGTADDLPYLRPAVQTDAALFNANGVCEGTNQMCTGDIDCGPAGVCRKNNPLKRFIFTNTTTPDAIGITIFSNPLHLTVREWYERDKAAGGQGFIGEVRDVKVDGYNAVTDGNNMYVDALNLSLPADNKYRIYNNIYLISINADAKPETRKVYDILLNNFKFNINLANDGYCGTTLNEAAFTTKCQTDMDCPSGQMCVAQKDKIKRNYSRLRALGEIEQVLDRYATNGNDVYPDLKEGTFLSGQAVSTWPSWGGAFATAVGRGLPTDPINRLGQAGTCKQDPNVYCLNDANCLNLAPTTTCLMHDPTTGWSDVDRRFSFACSTSSYAFRYSFDVANGYNIRAKFERPFGSRNVDSFFMGDGSGSWSSFISAFIHNTNRFILDDNNGICTQGEEITSLQSGRCGDGKINLDRTLNRMEQCDPPGTEKFGACGDPVSSRMTVSVCTNSCTWTASNTMANASFPAGTVACSYSSKCGNGIVEAGETCDEGAALNNDNSIGHCNSHCTGIVVSNCGNDAKDNGELCEWNVLAHTFNQYSSPVSPGTCQDSPATVCYSGADCHPAGTCAGVVPAKSCNADNDCTVKLCRTSGRACVSDTACNATITIPPQDVHVNFVVNNNPLKCTNCSQFSLGGASLNSCAFTVGPLTGGKCSFINGNYECKFTPASGGGLSGFTPGSTNFVLPAGSCRVNGARYSCLVDVPGQNGMFCAYTARISFFLNVNPVVDSCIARNIQCNLPVGVCNKPATGLLANNGFTQFIDTNLRSRYAVNRDNSCNWDCKSYGPYCGDGTVQSVYGEECEQDDNDCSVGGVAGKRLCKKNSCLLSSPAVSWWRFENVFRRDNSSNNDILPCGAHCPTPVVGRFGNGLRFNGTSSYLEVAHNNSLMSSQFSVEAWIRPEAGNGRYARILEKGGYNGDGGYDLEFNEGVASTTVVRFNVWDAPLHANGLDSANLNLNEWAHVVGTYDGNTNKLYINGVMVQQKGNVNMLPSVRNLFIGRNNGTNASNYQFFKGTIDEVSYYSRALTDVEVKDRYESGNVWFCSTTPAAAATANKAPNCGDGIQDSDEACDNGDKNGVACPPKYNMPCTYCSSDCKNIFTVEKTEFCGNGVIDIINPFATPILSETCDTDGQGNIWSNTSNPSSMFEGTLNTINGQPAGSDHKGYRAWRCEERNFGVVGEVYYKGDLTCGSCSAVSGCITCGRDTQTGVAVNGNLINVLNLGAGFTGPYYLDAARRCYRNVDLSVGDFLDTLTLMEGRIGTASKNNLGNTVCSINPTKFFMENISADPICSNSDPKYIFNLYDIATADTIDKTHRITSTLFVVKGQPDPWQYDVILSPRIYSAAPPANTLPAGQSARPNDIRIVVSWTGNSAPDFSGGFFTSQDLLEDTIIPESINAISGVPTHYTFRDSFFDNKSSACKLKIIGDYYYSDPDVTLGDISPNICQVDQGVTYTRPTENANRKNDGIWRHPFFNSVLDSGNSFATKGVSFTIDTLNGSGMRNNSYAFYIRSPGPIQDVTSNLKVDVYFPTAAAGTFSMPSRTFYFSRSQKSANTNARLWHVFNIRRSDFNQSTQQNVANRIETLKEERQPASGGIIITELPNGRFVGSSAEFSFGNISRND